MNVSNVSVLFERFSLRRECAENLMYDLVNDLEVMALRKNDAFLGLFATFTNAAS